MIWVILFTVLAVTVFWAVQTMAKEKLRQTRTLISFEKLGPCDNRIKWTNALDEEFTIRGFCVSWLHEPKGEETSVETKIWAANQEKVQSWK